MQDTLTQRAGLATVSARGYHALLAGLLASLGLVLFTVVEMRRAILLPVTVYWKLGAPSAFLHLHPIHAPALLIGLTGAWLSYRALARRERTLLDQGVDLNRARNVLALGLMALLIVDLFTYRLVQAGRVASAGSLSVSFAFPVADLPIWLRPIGEAANFLLVVWHATTLGILIGALFLVLLLSGRLFKRVMGTTGFRAHVAGALLAVPYPFCSCCAGPVGATLYRGGASLGPTLAFAVGAPMLNVTTLSLALALLPGPFALLRIVGGVVAAVLGTYLVCRAARRPPPAPPTASSRRAGGWLEAVDRLFAFEQALLDRPVDTPARLIGAWLSAAWRLARVVVPLMFLAAAVIGVLAPVIFAFGGRNDVPTVVLAAALGTLFMVPTWTELALAGPLIQQGLTGPAAALLLTLPAVSLPSLTILSSALGDSRVPALLATVVFGLGVLGGLLLL